VTSEGFEKLEDSARWLGATGAKLLQVVSEVFGRKASHVYTRSHIGVLVRTPRVNAPCPEHTRERCGTCHV
jgi:hypothetical protein